MKQVFAVSVVVCVLSLSACSGSDKTGTGPTPVPTPIPPPSATPTVTNLSMDGLDSIRSGFFSNFVATASLSNGTTQVVSPAWSSDNSGVATVASNGDVTGQSNGTATIVASYQGRTTAKTVRVVANFGGGWVGTYRLTKCDQSGVFTTAKWCQGLGGVGVVLPIGLSLTQGGVSRDLIGGTIALGSITGTITGNVTGDGRLILGSSFPVNSGGFTFSFTFGGWETRLSGATGMTGKWAHSLVAIGAAGNAYQENEFVSITHTSNAASLAVESKAVPTVPPAAAPSSYHMTIEEFAQSLH